MSKQQQFKYKQEKEWVSRNRLGRLDEKAKVRLMEFYNKSLEKEEIRRNLILKIKQNIQDRFAKVQNYDLLESKERLQR